MKSPYEDILSLPHPTSPNHPRMSLAARAAQFAPFAALTGHQAAIEETARLTEEKVELSEQEIEELNSSIRILQERIQEPPRIELMYFVPDGKKAGGAYHKSTVRVRWVDVYHQLLCLEDGRKIPLGDLIALHLQEQEP